MQGECELEIARNIGSDYVISGTITVLSQTYLVTLKLYDTASSALLSSVQVQDADPLTLVNKVRIHTELLVIDAHLSSDLPNENNENPKPGFEDVIRYHFFLKRDEIKQQVQGWITKAGAAPKDSSTLMQKAYAELCELMDSLDCEL